MTKAPRRVPRARAALAGALALLLVSAASAAAAHGGDPPPKSPPRSFFAVGPQAGIGPSDIKRMAVGGIGRLRLNFAWAGVDSDAPAGDFDWKAFDAVVGEAARQRITILPVLFGTPSWVALADGHDCYPGCQVFLPQSGPALDAWRAYVAALVGRYGPGGQFWLENPAITPAPIRSWQIWNEQNSGQYAQPQGDVRPYAKLLSVAARTIHRIDPGARVVLGGMFNNPVSDVVAGIPAERYLRELYRRPHIEERFEGLAIHPYSYRFAGVTEQVEALRSVAEEAGDHQVTTWITEVGWASGGIAHPLNKGLEGQARLLGRAYRLFLRNRDRWKLRLVSWFSWRDSAGAPICKWCPESGLFEAAFGLHPKPAWQAFVHFTGGA